MILILLYIYVHILLNKIFPIFVYSEFNLTINSKYNVKLNKLIQLYESNNNLWI